MWKHYLPVRIKFILKVCNIKRRPLDKLRNKILIKFIHVRSFQLQVLTIAEVTHIKKLGKLHSSLSGESLYRVSQSIHDAHRRGDEQKIPVEETNSLPVKHFINMPRLDGCSLSHFRGEQFFSRDQTWT